jgi:DNA polymerase-3 subunit delta'
MRKYFSSLTENSALRERIGIDCESGRLSHAYIIEGARGSGKKTLAYLIAAADNCEKKNDQNSPLPCTECPSCKKILGRHSPDVTCLEKPDDRATISVDTVREMRRQMYISPNELSKKYYIIDEADSMTLQAQNALLKNLEEPPSDAIMFLLCESSENLLETIRSRAPRLRMQLLCCSELMSYLNNNDRRAASLSHGELEELCVSAGGSIGQAFKMLDAAEFEKVKQQRCEAIKLSRLCAKGVFDGECSDFMRTMPQKREKLKELLSLSLVALRDMAALKKTRGAPLCFLTESQRDIPLPYSTEGIVKASDRISSSINALNANANTVSVMLNLLCGN